MDNDGRRVLECNKWWMDWYHALRRMPESSDPNTELGAQILRMKRELRKLRGRPQRRGKRGKRKRTR